MKACGDRQRKSTSTLLAQRGVRRAVEPKRMIAASARLLLAEEGC
jgi:hypothetical protein